MEMSLRELVLQVLASWQVLAATVAVILYIFLIGYVTKTRRSTSSGEGFTMVSPNVKPESAEPEITGGKSGGEEDDGLGLEQSDD
jgi:hypothetical protein